jgi:hypothetical protein
LLGKRPHPIWRYLPAGWGERQPIGAVACWGGVSGAGASIS